MKYKQELSRQNYKAGYVIVKGIVDGSEFGCDDYEMSHAENPSGDWEAKTLDDAKQMAIDFAEDVS